MVAAAEPVEALRARVVARVRPGDRVALLAEVPGLEEALRAAGCALLLAPLSPLEEAPAPLAQRLRAFAPTHVALRAPPSPEALESVLALLVDAAPGAELLVWFAHAAASSALLEALVGQGGAPALAVAHAERCFAAAGLCVHERESLGQARLVTSLAEETERALHALLAQLQPLAGGQGLLYVLKAAPAPAPSTPARVPGLLSVLLPVEEGDAALDELLFSLACQEYPELELVFVTRTPARREALRTQVAPYLRLGRWSLQFAHAAPGREVEAALEVARGQYLAFLAPGWVVYPGHYTQLIQALREGGAAWAVARARYALTAPAAPALGYIQAKRPFPLGERLELEHLRNDPSLVYALVMDRERLGPFALTGGALASLPLRLGALFRPCFLAGLASCERRVVAGEEAGPKEPWPELQVLGSLPHWEERVEQARADGARTRELRHQLVDRLNARLREGLPWLHGALRRVSALRR